jgi:hypothetical protein
MAINFTLDGASRFKIRRPLTTLTGAFFDVDRTIKTHLTELNEVLGRRIFNRQGPEWEPNVGEIVALELRPRRVPPRPDNPPRKWANNSLAQTFATRAAGQFSLGDYIDQTPAISKLKYAFEASLSSSWLALEPNAKAVLEDYQAIRDYLVACAQVQGRVHDLNSLTHFILSNAHGAKNIADYAIVSAARTLVTKEQIKVNGYNDDDSVIVRALREAGLPLSTAFRSGANAVINNFVFNREQDEMIEAFEDEGLGPVPVAIKPQLIKYMKASTIPIVPGNANTWIPLLIQQIQGNAIVAEPTEVDAEESEKDFDVADFLQDDSELLQVSRSAVKCASQLYFSMVLGDELNVFDVANYFTHKYLIRGGIEVLDRHLRDDLQMYVFSNKFTDLRTNRTEDRTRPVERQMFYRQVFNEGYGQVTDDVIVNDEFPRLWKILILESAKYLERAQTTFNQDSLSPQNVMQSVEDLQYNLSTHCTGMANVITPLIYAELDFIIQRIFKHPEVVRQVVPQGGTWWRVVETLYMGMKNSRPRSTVIYNKANLGNKIIRAIADYNQSEFEDDQKFSEFISLVDAFITTQSILQEALTDDLKKPDETDAPAQNGYSNKMYDAPVMAAAGTNGNGKPAADEWDF